MPVTPATVATKIVPTSAVRVGENAVIELADAVFEVLGAGEWSAEISALLVTDPGLVAAGLAQRAQGVLEAAGITVTTYGQVPPNPTTAAVDAGADLARNSGAEIVIALGGGSALDAAKGIALLATNPVSALEYCHNSENHERDALPLIAVPTTAGTGAECNGFGVIEDPDAQVKLYISNESAMPAATILDPALCVGLPARGTAATGFDALIHGIESLTSRGSNPLSEAYAAQAVRMAISALPRAVAQGADLEARARMLWAAHLAGRALTLSGSGIIHGLAHAITALTGTAHGIALAAVAEPILRDQQRRNPQSYERVETCLAARDVATNPEGVPEMGAAPGTNVGVDVASTIAQLVEQIGISSSLRDLGITADLIPAVVDKALADPVSSNTVEIPQRAELVELLRGVL